MDAITKATWALAIAGSLALSGCTKESQPGGPGAVGGGQQGETEGQAGTEGAVNEENTFTLEVPAGNIELDQGATEQTSIEIDRGDNFNQMVTVTFKSPQGISVEPKTVTLQPDQEEAEVKIVAGPSAPVGEATVEVSATPETGKAVAQTVKVKVQKASPEGGQQQGSERQASDGNPSSATK